MHIFTKKVAEKFGGIRKMLYLCTRNSEMMLTAKIQKKINKTAFFLRKFTFMLFLVDISCHFRDFYYFCNLKNNFLTKI
jgi:hypothetical protein